MLLHHGIYADLSEAMKHSARVLFTIGAAIAAGCASSHARDTSVHPSGSPRAAISPRQNAAAEGPLSLQASLSARTLEVRQGGTAVAAYTIGVGTDRHPTPTGTFRIRRLIWNPRWVPPDAEWARKKTAKDPGDPDNPMRVVKIFFREPDYYIHGTPATTTLGDAASHGCLRMAPDEAADVGKWLMEHGGQPRPESWFRRILRLGSQEQVIYLQNPITLTITS